MSIKFVNVSFRKEAKIVDFSVNRTSLNSINVKIYGITRENEC